MISDADAVRLDLAHLPVDVERFLDSAAKGLTSLDRGDLALAKAELTAAVNLYAGDFLEEDQYNDWAISLATKHGRHSCRWCGRWRDWRSAETPWTMPSMATAVSSRSTRGTRRLTSASCACSRAPGDMAKPGATSSPIAPRMHEIGVAAAPFPSAHHT